MTAYMDEAAIQAQIEADRASSPQSYRTGTKSGSARRQQHDPTRGREQHHVTHASIPRCSHPHPDLDLVCTLDAGHDAAYPTHKTAVPLPTVRKGNGHLNGDYAEIHAWDNNGPIKQKGGTDG